MADEVELSADGWQPNGEPNGDTVVMQSHRLVPSVLVYDAGKKPAIRHTK